MFAGGFRPPPDGFYYPWPASIPFEFDLGPLLLFPHPYLFLSSGLEATAPLPVEGGLGFEGAAYGVGILPFYIGYGWIS